MRIVIFVETFLPKMDGIVRVTCLFADHLKARGHQVMIVAPSMRSDIHDYNGMPVVRVPGVRLPWYPELTAGPPRLAQFRQIKAFAPDVAHIFHPVMIGVPGMWMAKHLGVPVLASFHLDMARLARHFRMGFLTPVADFATRFVFNRADYVLAPSQQVRRDLLALGVRDVGLWRRGVDAVRFHPGFADPAIRQRLSDGHPDDPLLLYVGRLSAEKRLDDLRVVLQAIPGARLAFIGDGPARADLERHFAGMPVHFAGYLHGDDLARAYASADLFVFPSALETFGLVVVEAMAAGLPVVASRVGGVPDVIREGETGYTFDPGDTAGMIAGVRAALDDPDRLRRMGQAARAYAETQSWPVMNDEVIAHYRRLVAAKRA